MPNATDKTTKAPPPITAATMRHLHGALRVHGIITDEAVHDYLTLVLERPVTSRKDLTEAEARSVLAGLEEAERPLTPHAMQQLRREFPPNEVGKLPRSTCRDCAQSQRKRCENHQWITGCPECRGSHSSATMHIDYVGHADVTARLLEVDPFWTWRPFTADEIAGIPPALRSGLWIMLTVLGVDRPGFGHAENDRQSGGDATKVAIGDALRNAAMRFGIALDLWAKGDREWAHAAKEDGMVNPPMDPAAPGHSDPPTPWRGPSTEALIGRLTELASDQGTDLEGITRRWREDHGGIDTEAMSGLHPRQVAPLVASIEAWIAKQAETAKQAEPAAAATEGGES